MQYRILKSDSRRRKFTLLELLIVISIIAILASILMPALSSVRQKTKSIQCVGNVKQIGLGISMYSNDNNGWLVPYQTASGVWKYWYLILGEGDYIPKNSYASSSIGDTGNTIMHCPASKPDEKGGYGTYYGINNYFCNTPSSSTIGATFLQIHKVLHPSLSVICADGKGTISPDWINNTPTYSVYWRHPGATANFLFVDGHVQPAFMSRVANLKWKNN